MPVATAERSTALPWTVAFAVYLPVLLWLDRGADPGTQLALGIATTLVLWLATRPLTGVERWQVYLCVAVSTAIELFSTQVWGVHTYRLGNVPLFVPPGHGLICAVAIQVARSPLMLEHRQLFARGTLAIALLALLAGLAGLTVLPRFTGRLDVEGALFLPGFAFLLLRTRRAAEHAATFFLASSVELWGVAFGNWEWSAVLPWLQVPAGNPPTVAAGGYCWFSAIAVFLLSQWEGREEGALAPPQRVD